jgi:signal transduction histidine kinase
MVEAYSGTIDVQSDKNKGTTITICLPAKSGHNFHMSEKSR